MKKILFALIAAATLGLSTSVRAEEMSCGSGGEDPSGLVMSEACSGDPNGLVMSE